MVERWEVKIGSPVDATDGRYGHLQQLLLDPQQERVVALLVRRDGLFLSHTVVVPEEVVASATQSEVRLKISREQVDALPEYKPDSGLVVEGRKYEADDKSFAVRGRQGIEVGRAPDEQQPGLVENQGPRSERERIGLRVRAGQQVFCRDGHTGRVSLILLDPKGRVKGFVLHAGHLPGRNLIVPAAWVQEVDRENVHLSVEKSALGSLPDYGSDDALAAQVDNALWSDDLLRNTDYTEIGLTVRDGVVRLRGHVATPTNKTRAEEYARSVAGVLGVENHLVVDQNLVIDVAQALGSNELTRSEQVSVGAQNGIITLDGQVGSKTIRDVAEAVAASVPQVRGVANYLQAPGMVVDPEEQQVRQPPIGQEVYATDILLGHIERVIINPHNRRVAAFVAHGNFPDPRQAVEYRLPDEIPQQERRVVTPIQAVRYETDSSVLLKISSVEAARNRDFDPTDYVSPPADWQPPYPYHRDEVLFEREDDC